MKRFWWITRPLVFLLWLASSHPSVLWHCFKDYSRYTLIRRGFLAGAANYVSQIRAEFETNAKPGQFNELFFDAYDLNIVMWCDTFPKFLNRSEPVNILEIGSWEGRSSLFLLTYFTQGCLTAVDTWAGGDEHQDKSSVELQGLEKRFDANLASCSSRLTKRKGSSLHVLPELVEEAQKFDLIYVDGSHFADDVLSDSINAWRLLEQDGLMIFDDLLWACYPRSRANPVWAINTFLRYHKGEYHIVNAYSQLIIQKRKSFDDQVTADVADLQLITAAAKPA